MKLSNIFKKETKTNTKANIQSLDKNQLAKVIGGTETTPEVGGDPEANRIVNKGVVKGSIVVNNSN